MISLDLEHFDGEVERATWRDPPCWKAALSVPFVGGNDELTLLTQLHPKAALIATGNACKTTKPQEYNDICDAGARRGRIQRGRVWVWRCGGVEWASSKKLT